MDWYRLFFLLTVRVPLVSPLTYERDFSLEPHLQFFMDFSQRGYVRARYSSSTMLEDRRLLRGEIPCLVNKACDVGEARIQLIRRATRRYAPE